MELEEAMKVWGPSAEAAFPPETAIPVRPLTREIIVIRVLLLVLTLTTVYALQTIDYQAVDLTQAVSDTLTNLKFIFLQPAGGSHLSSPRPSTRSSSRWGWRS